MNIQFAIATFVILLGAVELLQWVRRLAVPFPVFIVGGLILAVVSNYDKLSPTWIAWLTKTGLVTSKREGERQ